MQYVQGLSARPLGRDKEVFMARKFFFVCAGLLCLALAYHLGAKSVAAQANSQVAGVVADACHGLIVVTPNGDVFARPNQVCAEPFNGPPVYAGNFWSGAGPTPAKPETWGRVKARYGTAQSISQGTRP